MAPSLFENVVNWIRTGYPEGIPAADYPPLLALLTPVLSESEITDIVLTLALEHGTETPTTEDRIRDAIHSVTEVAPSSDETRQVAARLAAAGWPLALGSADADPAPADPSAADSSAADSPAAESTDADSSGAPTTSDQK